MDRPLLRLVASPALLEKRLRTLLGPRREEDEPRLREAVEDAQILGSLDLAGRPASDDDLRAARRGEGEPGFVHGLLRAGRAVEPSAPVTAETLLAWHSALLGRPASWRATERTREDGPPPAPAAFIEPRVRSLEAWLDEPSGRALGPAQRAALVLARVHEILPFEEGNGLLARLAASHLMVGAGARPPVLVAEDRARLDAALAAAHRLETEPLCRLLEEASARALEVMVRALESRPSEG
jgi:Fic/DOC family protein